MKKKLMTLLVVCMLIISSGFIFAGGDQETDESAGTANIALLHTLTGLGDKGMNDNVYSGLLRAEKELGITYSNVEPKQMEDYETFITHFANSGEYDIIFLTSTDYSDTLKKMAPLYPDQKFVAIAFVVDEPNVISITNKFNEYTFAAGYLASSLTTSGVLDKANDAPDIGFIYAMDIPVQLQASAGFQAGAKLANKDTNIRTGVIGDFQNINVAKELTLAQIANDTDIIMQFAGKAGLGVISGAEEAGAYSIGVSVNQNGISPDSVIATAINDLGAPVYNEVKNLLDGNWEPGIKAYGIKEGAMYLDYEGSNVEVPADIKDAVEEIVQSIKDGKLSLPNNMDELDSWIEENCE